MSAALRSVWNQVVQTKRAYMNPHEDFGRANIFRAAIGTYIAGFLLFKWNSSRKAKALKNEKATKKQAIAEDALARAGLA
uniref:ATP synthase subunit e, mitochondrial n=1 Tax=Panagrolaimus sp. ES5 TaxID=591445 RepID=A0AC34GYK0_9BILA